MAEVARDDMDDIAGGLPWLSGLVGDVAGRTGLTRATARRLLLTLGQLGYVSTSGRQFSLTPRVLDIGYAYLSSLNVQQIAQPGTLRPVRK